jgi:preprotein translocase subunit SecG
MTLILVISILLNVVLIGVVLASRKSTTIITGIKSDQKQSVWTDKTFGTLLFTAPRKL